VKVPPIHSSERPEIIRTLLARDGQRCWLCDEPMPAVNEVSRQDERAMSIDHVTPRSRGGTNELANLRLAHIACNNRRADTLAPTRSEAA
jgi:5-methylcytosine-specific restriction endonuclease McrA